MAQRRMFSKTITSSARFLKMPQEAQNLYFHLCMNADDDGIVEAFTIMQMLGSGEDIIRFLAVKNFVRPLNEDMVSYIMDWNEHNLIRADRKVNSIYKDLLVEILPDVVIIEPRPRADTGVIPRQITTGRPLDSIGKDSIGKDSIVEREQQVATPKSVAREFFTNLDKQSEFVKELTNKGISENIAVYELNKFLSYWTEPNSTGKKQRWEMEKTFEVSRRLATWFSRISNFNQTSKKTVVC